MMSTLIVQMQVIEELARLMTKSIKPSVNRERAESILTIAREVKNKLEESFWTTGKPLSDIPGLHKTFKSKAPVSVAPDLLARYK